LLINEKTQVFALLECQQLGQARKGKAIHLLKTLAGHRIIQTMAACLYSSPILLKAAVELP